MPSKRGQDRSRLLSGNIPSHSSIVAFDQATYGEIDQIDAGRRIAEPISIFDIYPDPMQPRRAVPSEVRLTWNGHPDGVPKLLHRWINWGRPDDLHESLVAASRDMVQGVSERDFDEAVKNRPIEVAYRKLVEVAAGIYRDGLINPITVSQDGIAYWLETGERRWLAFHLLHLLFEDEQWLRIPAHLVETPNVWRQALENNSRDNLNAVGRARQLAILIMDILGADNFLPFEDFENEREYYAQVADGETYRIPRGQTEQLLQAMGLKDNAQVRQYRRLLRLPDDVWRRADDENWTEGKLRKFIPNDEDSVTTVTVSPPTLPVNVPGTREHFAALEKAIRKAGRGDRHAKDNVLSQIAEIRRWLDEVERDLNE